MSEYLRLTKVEVVSSVDLDGLNKTLQWLVSKVQDLPTAEQGNQKTIADSLLQDQIDALRRENNSLKDALAQLQQKQSDIEGLLDTKQDRDQAAPNPETEAPGPSDSVTADLERRVTALEQRAEQAVPQASSSEDTTDSPETARGNVNEAASGPAGPDLASQFQELLAGHRALAATVSGLQHELESKPNRGELDLKANRSELDALLRAGVNPASANADAAGASALAVAADGSLDSGALADTVNKVATELGALRGQLAVLQDRIQDKAEQGGVDDLAAQVAAIKARGIITPAHGATAAASGRGANEVAHPSVSSSAVRTSATGKASEAAALPGPSSTAPLESVLQALAPTLNGLTQRMDQLEVRVAAAGPSAASGNGSDKRAVDAIGSLADVQPLLKDIYARVNSKAERSALEDALQRLHDLAAALDAKADAAALHDLADRIAASQPPSTSVSMSGARAAYDPAAHPPQQQWIVSHELSEVPLPPSGALDDLRLQVADLANQVAKLATLGAGAAAPAVPAPTAPLAGRMSAGLEGLDLPGALAALQGQLGELGTRLAGKADAGEVARLELALNGKADADEVAELRLALGGKADAGALGDLQMAVAGKADQAALDEVKLTAALAADLAAGSSGAAKAAEGDDAAGGGGYQSLLGAIQNMVADKAGKSELAALQGQVSGKASASDVALLRAALDDKAPAAELAALVSQLPARAASAEEIASLDERMGDVFAEIGRIRADLAALPTAEALAAAAAAGSVSGSGGGGGSGSNSAREGGGGDTAGLQRMISALSREVGTLREGLDTVAHAANVLAVGLDGGVRSSMAGETRYSENGVSGKENRSPRGGYDRMVKLLGSGEYRHKMDAFDPAALQQMAQKLAYLEATMKSPAMGRIAAGAVPGVVDYGMKELERQVKRLATDVRLMKDKVIDPSAFSPTAGRHTGPGDHAMLAGRPITGYRCMACDRPLDQLDNQPGPHIPTQQLPVRGPPVADNGIRPQARSGRGDPLSPQGSSHRLQFNNDPAVRGVQNWYKDSQGLAAEALPREHVGPHLPPGGWRPSNPGIGAKVPNNLPVLDGSRSRRGQDYDQKVAGAVSNGQPEGVPGSVSLPQIS